MEPVQFFKCLADDTRLRCVLLIQQERELCVCELMVALDDIQPKISRHLAQLRKCGLLVDERRGQWVHYRLNPALPDWCQGVLKSAADLPMHYLKSNTQKLHKMGSRPERQQVCC